MSQDKHVVSVEVYVTPKYQLLAALPLANLSQQISPRLIQLSREAAIESKTREKKVS